jgi:serine/threonine protein kinase
MFSEGQQLDLPDLAHSLGLPTLQFTVGKLIRGGMGVCVQITHGSSGKVFALKLINEASLASDLAFRRFLEEVKLWRTASSCNAVVQVLSVFRLNEIPCVCSEWMEGGDLGRYLERRDEVFFYRCIDRILGGLEWVYTNYGIIHRDLKPSNILLDRDLNSYIADWGISRALSLPAEANSTNRKPSQSPAPLTQTGGFIGTVMYSAPEQIIGSKEIDHRADIYSIGCMLFEWETGAPPFTAATPEKVAYHHLQSPVPRVGGFLKRSRFGVQGIIARCLQKKPGDRYETYATLRSALRVCAKSRGIEFTPFTPIARESMPLVGSGELQRNGFRNPVVGSDGNAVVEWESVLPYLKEASLLCNVGEWRKAHDILIRLYVPEMFASSPDHEWHQEIATNLGLCLLKLDRATDAINVFTTISPAERKSSEYFVNFSLALLQAQRHPEAESVAREGLELYSNDFDVLGNLGIALRFQGRREEALEVAQKRLSGRRDVHSLEELAGIHIDIGRELEDRDWPRATSEFATAIRLLDEAKNLNPRFLSARLTLAKAWFCLDDFGAASEELGDIQFDKGTEELRATMYAECLNRTGLFEQCVAFCDKRLKESPDSVGLKRIRAETLVDAYVIGKEKDGVRIVENSSLEFFVGIVGDSKRRTASDIRYLARLREWTGDTKAALELIDKAEQLQPDEWANSFQRAMFYWHMGDLKSALEHGHKASTLGRWRPQTWRLVAAIQDSLGENTEAKVNRDGAEQVEQARISAAQQAVAAR